MTIHEAADLLEHLDHQRNVVARLISIKVAKNKPKGVSARSPQYLVVSVVSKITCVPAEKIKGSDRHREVKNARHLVTYILLKDFGLGATRCGSAVNRDHSNVYNSVEYVDTSLANCQKKWATDEDKWIVEKLQEARQTLKQYYS